MTAIRRRRGEYTQQLLKHQQMELLAAEVQADQGYDLEQKWFEEMPLLLRLENDVLLNALKEISERERHVFLSHVLDEKSFEALAMELGLSYKGVAAIYYRVIRKMRKRMEELE